MSAVTTGGRDGIRQHGLAALAFAGLALLLTWPLATAAGAAIPGDGYGDNVTFLWNFWWMRHALASATDAAFSSTYLFYPAGIDLTLHTHTALGAWLGATAGRTLSAATALDVYIWLCVGLNGFCTYLLAWRLTRNRAAALVAGLFFAASPYFTGRLRGHVNLLGAWCLPAFWLCFTRALDERSPRAAIAAGLVLAAAPYIDYYYTVYLFVLAGCLLAVRGWRMEITLASPPRAQTSHRSDHPGGLRRDGDRRGGDCGHRRHGDHTVRPPRLDDERLQPAHGGVGVADPLALATTSARCSNGADTLDRSSC